MDPELEIPRLASRFLSKDPPPHISPSQSEKISALLSILALSPKERSQGQMRLLAEHMKGVKFFKDLVDKEGQYALMTSMQYLGLQGGKAGQVTFKLVPLQLRRRREPLLRYFDRQCSCPCSLPP